MLKWQNVPLTWQRRRVFGTADIVKGFCSGNGFSLPFIPSSRVYHQGTHGQVLQLTPSVHNSFFKRVISAVYFSYYSPRASAPRPDRPFERMIGPPARWRSLLGAGLRAPERF